MEEIKIRLKGLGLTDSTIRTYINILSHFFKHIGKVNNITEQDINAYLDYLMVVKNYKARSRNLVSKVIKFYCREFLGFEPKIKKAKEDKPIQPVCWDDDYRQILSVTKNPKHRIILNLMRYSGLRKHEAVCVMKHHILEDGRLFIKGGKGQKDRYVIIAPQIMDELMSYKNLLNGENAYLFPGRSGIGHYSDRTPSQILNNAFTALGWHKSRWYGCHSLRRFCVIFLVDIVRLDFDEVSKIMGHSVMRVTQIYTQSRKLKLDRAICQYKAVNCIIH